MAVYRPLFWWVGMPLSILAGTFAPQLSSLRPQNEKWATPKNLEEKALGLHQLPVDRTDRSGLRKRADLPDQMHN